MTITKVIDVTAVTTTSGPTTLAIPFGSTAAAGDIIVVCAVCDATGAWGAVSGYTAIAGDAAGNQETGTWFKVAAGTETTVTVAGFSAGSMCGWVSTWHTTQAWNSSQPGVSNVTGAITTNANPQVGAAVTTTNGSLGTATVGVIGSDSAEAAAYTATGGGFTRVTPVQSSGGTTNVTIATCWRIDTAAGTWTPTWTISSASGSNAQTVSFYESAAAAPAFLPSGRHYRQAVHRASSW